MAKKGSGGWLIPVVILALPALAFYFWWAKVSGAHKASVLNPSQKASVLGVFGAAPPGAKLANPESFLSHQGVSHSSSAAVGIASATPKVSRPAVLVPRAIAIASSSGATNASRDFGFAPKSRPASLARVGAVGKTVGLEAKILPPPELRRDPTLSPDDRQEVYDRLHPKPKPKIVYHRSKKKKSPPIETLIDLEGIIFVSPTNVKAIINGTIMRPGESVKGAKIESIQRGKVHFSYKGRRFVKVMKGNQ